MISVAAELAGVHPQTLRIYERKELICPQRSGGNTRLYSEADIERLRLIQQLTQIEGINLAGVMRIMELERELERAREELDAAHRYIARVERAHEDRARKAHVRTALVHVRGGAVTRWQG
jgi:MerR family transcriptional regulator/heat shock protein HspR